jgi:hypothetical protein
VPRGLLRRFHDHFSIYYALTGYAHDPSIRDMLELRADDERLWEAVLQTVALAEDVGGRDQGLSQTVKLGLDDLPGVWLPLTVASDLTPLAGSSPQAIVPCLDSAVSSGQAYILAYADALSDGLVLWEEAAGLDRRLAVWRSDLEALQAAMAETFGRLGEMQRQATASWQSRLADAAERMIRSLAPWHTGNPGDLGSWLPSSPTYLEQALLTLQDFPAEDVTMP